MGKNKDKKAKRTTDVFLGMSPYSICVQESPGILALSTDMDSSSSCEKAKKKRALLSQECEKERRKDCEDVEDGLTAETSLEEEPVRKKKKKENRGQNEETFESDTLRKKDKKKKKKRSIDEVDKLNLRLESDENEMMSDERTGGLGKKKKKNKEKENLIQILDSAALSAQSVQENSPRYLHEMETVRRVNGGCSALTEPEENQAENIGVKTKKKDKKKKNQIEILGFENVSTDPCVMDINVSAEPAEYQSEDVLLKTKKKKKKKDEAKKSQIERLESEKYEKKNGSADPHEQDSVNALTEPDENQTTDILVEKKKKKKHKEKQNRIKMLQSVKENASTEPHEMESVNVSTEAEENHTENIIKKKKRKHKEKHNQVLGSATTEAAQFGNVSVNVSTEAEENHTENIIKKKKEKKRKHKEKQNQVLGSATTEAAQFGNHNGFTEPHEMDDVNVSTEPGDSQAETIFIKKKKEKKRKHKEKQNQPQVLGSATTEAEQSVNQNGSTDPHEMDSVNVSTEPEESPTKKRKSNSKTHKNGDLKTREAQTVPGTINPKNEQETDEGSEDNRVQIGTGFEKKNGKKGPKEIDRRLLEELKEFVPNVESRAPADINKFIHYDLPRYKEFKKKGIPLTHGRFTVKENEILKKNVEDFLALTGIDSGTKLFYTHRFTEEQDELRKLKKNHRFFSSIAEGIPRSCHEVYARGRKVFDSNAYKGTFSKSEIHQLCKLQTLHGNNWKKISELTGRSALSLEKRYSQITKRSGIWSQKELQRLLRAVRDHIVSEVRPNATNIGSIQVSRETLYKGLPWRTISEKVKTRSWNKCREKWLSVLAVKMSAGAVQTNDSKEAKVKLIKAMNQMQVEDVADVDWDKLSALFGDVPPFYVQRKWNKLKIMHVPNWQSKCFADIVDFLYEKVMPDLEKEVTHQDDNNVTQLEESQVKSFHLSDIFKDVNDQDADETDEGDKNRRQ